MSRDRTRRSEQKRLREACPNESVIRDLSFRLDEAQHVLFGLKTVGDVVDPAGLCALKTEQFIEDAHEAIEELTPALGKERRDFVRAERVKDEWASPSCVDGWMCPDSPNGACDYEEGGDPDSCDYCGHPGERK
jgi:hypothetical protein